MFGCLMIFFCFEGKESFFTLATFKWATFFFMFRFNVLFCMEGFTKSLVAVRTDSSEVSGFLFLKRMVFFFSSGSKFVKGLLAESTHFMKFKMVAVMEK